jgi:hypothetical protein
MPKRKISCEPIRIYAEAIAIGVLMATALIANLSNWI